jgi:hypothetical protein
MIWIGVIRSLGMVKIKEKGVAKISVKIPGGPGGQGGGAGGMLFWQNFDTGTPFCVLLFIVYYFVIYFISPRPSPLKESKTFKNLFSS